MKAENYRTCCNAKPEIKGKLNYVCPVCGDDITMDLYYLYLNEEHNV